MTPSTVTARQKKLKDLHNALQEYQALIVLTGQYNAAVRHERERALAALDTLTKRELDNAIEQVESQIDALRKVLGARYPRAEYVRLLHRFESHQGELLFVPKWVLKHYFRNIEDFMSIGDLPEHTRISVDYVGSQPASIPAEVRITEAALFEDMCAMFNSAWELASKCVGPDATKREIKASAAARRGAVVAAFYLIEAYLNSLAFDHVVNHGGELSEAELGKLTEWDYARDRERFVSFRDKLLGYPMIIKGVQFPLLQENNCPEIAFLLGQATSYRDAIVHANPKPDVRSVGVDKELTFWMIGSCTPIFRTGGADDINKPLETDVWIRTVDNAIDVVAKVETTVHGDPNRLFWLSRRSEVGPFPDSVFE